MDIAKRTLTAISWKFTSNAVKVVILFARSIILARLLPVEVFGVYSFALAIVGMSSVLVNFGLASAFFHRAPETEDEDTAAAVHFSIMLVLTTAWFLVVATCAFFLTSGTNRIALLALMMTSACSQLVETPRVMLGRRIIHRRLAVIDLIVVVLASVGSIFLATNGLGLAALISIEVIGLLVSVVILYLWRPVWRPRWLWKPEVVRYFFRFGSRLFVVNFLTTATEKLDQLWTGAYLNPVSLGFYSRAYAFARYPRSILSDPLTAVLSGTYSELKEHKASLSLAFFHTNAVLIRCGFLLAGMLALVAPELIRMLLGEKWLPMLDAFRLMLVYTMLDPIKKSVGNIFPALGRPGQLVYSKTVQIIVLIAGLYVLGPRFGISGVAVATNLALLTGMAVLLWNVSREIEVSLIRLFSVPLLALVAAVLVAAVAPGLCGGDLVQGWQSATLKMCAFVAVYCSILLTFEFAEIRHVVLFVLARFRN
jgi:polysaccharide transporter, PST family